MKGHRHTPEQVVRKLREGERLLNEGKDLAEVLRTLEISEATWNRWRNQYGGMKADEMKRPKDLERENARLKAPSPTSRSTRRSSRRRPGETPKSGATAPVHCASARGALSVLWKEGDTAGSCSLPQCSPFLAARLRNGAAGNGRARMFRSGKGGWSLFPVRIRYPVNAVEQSYRA